MRKLFCALLFLSAFWTHAATLPCHSVPQIDAHLGTWKGTYRYYDAEGTLWKKHESVLNLRRECNRWIQSNEYIYEDGRHEKLLFEGDISEQGVLRYTIGRVQGKAWGIENGLVLLQWSFVGKDDTNTEIINLLDENNRMRSWQLSEAGKPKGFVQITETRAYR